MKAFIFTVILLMFTYLGFGYFSASNQCTDTVFLKNKIITGKILDISPKYIKIQTTGKIRQIPLAKVQSAKTHCFNPSPQLRNDTIIVDNKQYTGYILYFNPLKSNILFYDFNNHSISQYPFYKIENDKTLKDKLKFYRANTYNSLFILLMSLFSIGAKYFLGLTIYLIASAILAVIGIAGCIIFCRPLIKYRKLSKQKK